MRGASVLGRAGRLALCSAHLLGALVNAWGFFVLDPQREGVRLQLIAELAEQRQADAGAARLLRAIGQQPPKYDSAVRVRVERAA